MRKPRDGVHDGALPDIPQLAEDRRVGREPVLVEVKVPVRYTPASYGGPTERLALAVLIIELRAIFVDVTRSPSVRTATSSRNLPYLLSPI